MNPFVFHISAQAARSSVPFPHPEHQQQPKERKGKRSRFPRSTIASNTHFSLGQCNPHAAESFGGSGEPKPIKRPYRKKAYLLVGGDVAAGGGKVVHPCTECGKRFCSWKALFGHMRCHPERQWRGINPPPDHHHAIPPPPTPATRPERASSRFGMEEEEVARCLIMLSCSVHANSGGSPLVPNEMLPSPGAHPPDPALNKASGGTHEQNLCEPKNTDKNVKGCLLKHGDDDHGEKEYGNNHHHHKQHDHQVRNMAQHHHHQCNVCMRVFSCGQALGGHMRYHHHWGDEKQHHHPPPVRPPASLPLQDGRNSHLDLNLPAPMDLDDLTDGSSTGPLGLDLKLGTGSTGDRNHSSSSFQSRPVFGASTYC